MIWWFGLIMGAALVEVGLMLMFTFIPIGVAFGGFSCVFGGMWLGNAIEEEKNENS